MCCFSNRNLSTPWLFTSVYNQDGWQVFPSFFALMPFVFTPLSSKTTRRPLGTLRAQLIFWGFPCQKPSCMTCCFPHGFTFILLNQMSNESSAIVPWQLLWLNIQMCLQPSVSGYFTSAISFPLSRSSMNLSEVQKPSFVSLYLSSSRACTQMCRLVDFALSWLRARWPFFSSRILCEQLQRARKPSQRANRPLRKADSCEPQPLHHTNVQILICEPFLRSGLHCTR